MSRENPPLAVIKIWAAMAWADGTIAPAESDTLLRLIDAAGLSPEDSERAASWLQTPVELDASSVAGLAENTRRGIYRVAAKLAAIDNHIDEGELALLERLRGLLGISADEASRIAETG